MTRALPFLGPGVISSQCLEMADRGERKRKLATHSARPIAHRYSQMDGSQATSLRVAEGFLDAFRDGMRERGYVEGQNLAIEFRAPAAASEQNRDVAADLVRGGYDVILAWTTPSVIAASRATSTVPIVFVGVADPVGLGLVAGLARPGANVTGIANFASDLSGKMIELLRVSTASAITSTPSTSTASTP